MTQDVSNQQAQIKLARQAASGQAEARKKINAIVEPMILYQNSRFCKRFCKENRFRYRCTLVPPLPYHDKNADLCEWGNGGYGWMLNDLTSEPRLLKYEGRNGASLFDYLYQIANSLPFYERWKDWRFGRRVHVPEYIKSLSPDAARVFLLLRSNEKLESIAQTIQSSVHDTETLTRRIVVELTRRRRLYLLNPATTDSLSREPDSPQQDVAVHDEAPELAQQKMLLHKAWDELDGVEQFVLEAMLIDDEDAEDVLAALRRLNQPIKKNVPADKTNVQQLYYFRRKTLQKLAEKMAEKTAGKKA